MTNNKNHLESVNETHTRSSHINSVLDNRHSKISFFSKKKIIIFGIILFLIILAILFFYFNRISNGFELSGECNSKLNPVCGVDSKTYNNACLASKNNIAIKEKSNCINPVDYSKINCPQSGSGACGVDGVTYVNRCFAGKAGVKVARDGNCTVS